VTSYPKEWGVKMRRLSYLLMFLLLIAAVPGILSAAERPGDPQIEITSPPNDATINGSEYEVAVQFVSSEKLPVTKIQVYLDGKPITARKYDNGQSEGISSFKWDTTRSSNGRHKVDVQIFSGDEYLGMSTCTVYVSNKAKDIIPPRVAVTSPREGAVVSGVTQIVIEAADNSGLEPMVNVYVDKSLRSVKNRGPYEYAWDTTDVENGPHTIEVNAEDDSTNTSPAKAIRVIVKNPLKPAPQMFGTSSVPTVSANITPSTPAPVAVREVARTTQPKSESFVAGPVPAANWKTATATPVRKIEPKLTLMAKADTTSLAVPQCCPGGICDIKTPTGPEPARAPGIEENAYIVREGDNLDTLAKKLGVTVEAIVKLNDLEDPSKLQIGQKLRMPAETRLIPVRPVFEAAGGTLIWEAGKSKVVRAICSRKDVLFEVGSARAVVNKRPLKMESAAVVNSGRTMVPESFVTGPLGMTVPGK
jgi:LysM repeat protein